MQRMNKQQALQQAKALWNPEGRAWLHAGSADSYGTRSNRAEFWVLEGSPPRGFIIACYGAVVRLDDISATGLGRRRKTFAYREPGP